jgi:hypothetical protein
MNDQDLPGIVVKEIVGLAKERGQTFSGLARSAWPDEDDEAAKSKFRRIRNRGQGLLLADALTLCRLVGTDLTSLLLTIRERHKLGIVRQE